MATVDHAGNIFTMEAYTAQTTDGNGDITVTLQNTPVGDNAIMVQAQGVTGAFCEFKSRTGTALTVTVRRDYIHLDVDTAGGTTAQLPGGVTEATASFNASVSGTTGGNNHNGGGNNTGAGAAKNGHTHSFSGYAGVNQVITHSHDTTTQVIEPLATTGGLTIVVSYAY